MLIDNYTILLLSLSIFSILLYSLYRTIFFYNNSEQVKSLIDNKYYIVRDTKFKQKSADILALLNKKILILINSLKNDPKPNKNTILLIRRYRPESLMENILLENTTFTVNKGEEISVCLSPKTDSDMHYDINKLMFVLIHELAHIGSESYGHTQEFKGFFIFLLNRAIKLKLYKYQNYFKEPAEYCGITINTTPLF